MIVGGQSSRAVRAVVAPGGRLVSADQPLLDMQLRAQGSADGVVAMPALLEIAELTCRLQMRVSRVVRVADVSADLDLLVESQFTDGAAHLEIYGLGSREASASERAPFGVNSDLVLHCDQRGVLLNAYGTLAGSIDIGHFGAPVDKGLLSFPAGFDLAVQKEQIEIEAQIGEPSKNCRCTIVPKNDAGGNVTGFELGIQHIQRTPSLTVVEPPEVSEIHTKALDQGLGDSFRQPLGRIIANAESIGSKLEGPLRDHYAVYAKDIASAAKHLVELLDDLGDLSAIEKSGFETAKDKIELGDIARRVTGLLALKAADQHINMVVDETSGAVYACAEFRRVLQIAINLLSNAIRYSPAGSCVTILVYDTDDFAELSISDLGPGITAENREKIFDKFERLGRSGDGGSGLGLYISRRLARAMGGELFVDPQYEDGARFILRVPKA